MNLNNVCNFATACILGSEGFAADAFLDRLAKPARWTIGHGTTMIRGQPVQPGLRCTLSQADQWAAADMLTIAGQVLRLVLVPLSERQLGALVSFAYNIGIGRFETSSVLEALNLGEYAIAGDRLLDYDAAGGHIYRGLLTRRWREREMFRWGQPTPEALAEPAPGAEPATAEALNQAELQRLNLNPTPAGPALAKCKTQEMPGNQEPDDHE